MSADVNVLPGVLQQARLARPLTQISERQAIERLAKEVPAGGLIVEIGTLYGGMTAVLALANPKARIITIDDFSWHPPDDTPASAGRFKSTMIRIGVDNVQLMVGNSRESAKPGRIGLTCSG